jgi:1,4-dihydroxy-6-naphthoate synthase
MSMKLSLGFSTCPNDTFIFDALVNNRLDKSDFEFDLTLADVEELNKKAVSNTLDITKISIAAYPQVANDYLILDSGAALGNNNGPLLISKNKIKPNEINNLRIAIPGFNTTANMLLTIAFPNATNKIEYLFSDIENAILNNEVDAGLIIHESRFTYQKKGLKKVIDLGEFWEDEFNKLIPLGCIVIKRSLAEKNIKNIKNINQMIKASVDYAFIHPTDSVPFVKHYAKEMENDVIQKHINLYVNQYSLDLGKEGRDAIRFLFSKGLEQNLLPNINHNIFID